MRNAADGNKHKEDEGGELVTGLKDRLVSAQSVNLRADDSDVPASDSDAAARHSSERGRFRVLAASASSGYRDSTYAPARRVVAIAGAGYATDLRHYSRARCPPHRQTRPDQGHTTQSSAGTEGVLGVLRVPPVCVVHSRGGRQRTSLRSCTQL